MFWRLLPHPLPPTRDRRRVSKYSPNANCIFPTRPRRFGLSDVFLDLFPSMFWRIPARVNGGKPPRPRGYCRMSPTHDRWDTHSLPQTRRCHPGPGRADSGRQTYSRDVPVHVLAMTDTVDEGTPPRLPGLRSRAPNAWAWHAPIARALRSDPEHTDTRCDDACIRARSIEDGPLPQICTYGHLHMFDPAAQIRVVRRISRDVPQHVLAITGTGQRGKPPCPLGYRVMPRNHIRCGDVTHKGGTGQTL